MSRAAARALTRLAVAGAVLMRERGGDGYGVFPRSDRRRRPTARLDAAAVRMLEGDGAIEKSGVDSYVLSAAGRARVRREAAVEHERYQAQHATISERNVIGRDGHIRFARGLPLTAAIRRLAALRDADGAPWLSGAEIAAAEQLRKHWEAGEAGLIRGSDWTAPPLSPGARGPGDAQERVLAARCDARRKAEEALAALAAPLRRVVERVCLHEQGLEALERAQGWPPRSAKLALKLGLAQLALALSSR